MRTSYTQTSAIAHFPFRDLVVCSIRRRAQGKRLRIAHIFFFCDAQYIFSFSFAFVFVSVFFPSSRNIGRFHWFYLLLTTWCRFASIPSAFLFLFLFAENVWSRRNALTPLRHRCVSVKAETYYPSWCCMVDDDDGSLREFSSFFWLSLGNLTAILRTVQIIASWITLAVLHPAQFMHFFRSFKTFHAIRRRNAHRFSMNHLLVRAGGAVVGLRVWELFDHIHVNLLFKNIKIP